MRHKPQTMFTGPELCALEAVEVVGLLRKGEISPGEALQAALQRTEEVEPAVNATVTTCPERALKSIEELEAKKARNSGERGWLAGLPISIKDLTPVAGVRTTYGTKALANFVPDESAYLVERLEENGGIVVGKTNSPEFGAGANTFNDVFGMTRNPWDTSKNAAGSSGGAAVALATGEIWLSHGSDLTGSLRTPAAYCGVVGLRPSPGRVARGPDTNGYNTEGVQGPMARSVRDCALFLDAMSGYEPRYPLSLEAPRDSFQQAVEQASPRIRIAFSRDLDGFLPVSSEYDSILRHALACMERDGATVEEACPDLQDLDRVHTILRAMTWGGGTGRAPEEVQRHFKKSLADNIELGRKLTIDEVYDAQIGRTRLFRTMQEFLCRYQVLACPVAGWEAGPVEEEYPTEFEGVQLSGYMHWLRFAFLATTTSLPAISVPVGFTKSGMPVGLQLIGPPRGEAVLLAAARALEVSVGGPLGPIDPKPPSS